jgi:hypothetical protein
MARVCVNCGTAFPPVEPRCPTCGDDCPTVDLMVAYSRQGRELNEAKDEIAKMKEER